MNKFFYTAITLSAIALNSTSVLAQETEVEAQDSQETVFVCGTESQTPTMFAYSPGNVNITPVITWHQEYLLPEQSGTELCQEVASKLQNVSQKQQEPYFIAERQEDSILVCLVDTKNSDCSSQASQPLFSVNSNYDPSCILDRREPLECMAVGQVRGVYSITDEPYRPLWWFW